MQHSHVYDFGSCYKLCSAQKQLLLGFFISRFLILSITCSSWYALSLNFSGEPHSKAQPASAYVF